ncbi:hypothetical protein HpBT138_10050 [Helicobacter pylori]
MYLNPHYETQGNRDEFTILSQWYKDHADKDDADEVYSFFIEAFSKSTLDNALYSGSSEAIAETSSDELILKAMNTAYIKKQILFCAIVARGELIKMIKRAGDKVKDNINIIVAAEKVSKLFIDAGVSLFGKEQIQAIEVNNSNNVAQMNMSDLLALANAGDNVD